MLQESQRTRIVEELSWAGLVGILSQTMRVALLRARVMVATTKQRIPTQALVAQMPIATLYLTRSVSAVEPHKIPDYVTLVMDATSTLA